VDAVGLQAGAWGLVVLVMGVGGRVNVKVEGFRLGAGGAGVCVSRGMGSPRIRDRGLGWKGVESLIDSTKNINN
jgi:hypothetical protein